VKKSSHHPQARWRKNQSHKYDQQMQNAELERWYADLSPAATRFAYSFASDLLSKPGEEQI